MSQRRDNTIPCPYCRQPMYEEAEKCPHCGNFLSEEDAPSRRSPWIVAGVLLCLVLALGWAVRCW